MKIYQARLALLKRDVKRIKNEKKKKKNKKFNTNEKIMIDFINAVTPFAEFEVNNQKIILRVGDDNKGFMHILKSHYCKGCRGEVTTLEILNMIDIVKKGINLGSVGVSNSNLIVYQREKTQEKLVLKPLEDGSLIITMYSIS
jgi:hypothetical protein